MSPNPSSATPPKMPEMASENVPIPDVTPPITEQKQPYNSTPSNAAVSALSDESLSSAQHRNASSNNNASVLPVLSNADSLAEVLSHYNTDNLPSNHLILPIIPSRLKRLIPDEFSCRAQNFHLLFFLWYEQNGRLPAALPKIAQEYTNFYCLYRVVTLLMGGFEMISHSKDGEWSTIWKNAPNYSLNATSSASSRVKSTYKRFLFPFEKEFFRHHTMMTWKIYKRDDASALQESVNSGQLSTHEALFNSSNPVAHPNTDSEGTMEHTLVQATEPTVSSTNTIDSDSNQKFADPIQQNSSVHRFMMETTWKLFQPKLARHIIGTEHKLHVDDHFISFSFEKVSKTNTTPSPPKTAGLSFLGGDDSFDMSDDHAPEYVSNVQVGDIVYSEKHKAILLVISEHAPVGGDFELVGRITPSADCTHDDIFSLLEELDLPHLIELSKKAEESKENSPDDLLLSTLGHTVSMKQHSRPLNNSSGHKRKRKSPKAQKKTKRVKGKDGKKRDASMSHMYLDEDTDFLPHNDPRISPNSATVRMPTPSFHASGPALSGLPTAPAVPSGNETIGVSVGTMTEPKIHMTPLGVSPSNEIVLIRYKFNSDADDEYRVIPIQSNKLREGEMTHADVRQFLEKDNVSLTAVCDIRYYTQALSNQCTGWIRMGNDWKFSLKDQLSREITLWILTKKGYEAIFGVAASDGTM